MTSWSNVIVSLDSPYAFLLMFNSNIWPNSALEFDLSRSLKIKCDGVIRLPVYAFLSMINCSIRPNSVPLQDIRLQNLSVLEFDLSRSLKVKCDDIIGLVIHGFLLICTIITCLTLTV